MSMVYDVIFMVQHYCLFAGNNDASAYGAVVELEEGEEYEGAVQEAGASSGPRRGRGAGK